MTGGLESRSARAWLQEPVSELYLPPSSGSSPKQTEAGLASRAALEVGGQVPKAWLQAKLDCLVGAMYRLEVAVTSSHLSAGLQEILP